VTVLRLYHAGQAGSTRPPPALDQDQTACDPRRTRRL